MRVLHYSTWLSQFILRHSIQLVSSILHQSTSPHLQVFLVSLAYMLCFCDLLTWIFWKLKTSKLFENNTSKFFENSYLNCIENYLRRLKLWSWVFNFFFLLSALWVKVTSTIEIETFIFDNFHIVCYNFYKTCGMYYM